MSLRDFNNAPFPDDPRALHNDPLGNGAGLENFHTVQPDDIEPNNTPKIVGAVAVALMVGVAGFALYTSGGSHSKTVVAANAPAEVAQPAPPPAAPAAATPDATTPPAADKAADAMPAPTKEPVKEASIAKKHHKTASADTSIKSADAKAASNDAGSAAAQRMAADTNQSTVQPQQQQEIAAPAPSPSDVASNTVPAPAQAQPTEQAQPQPATPAAPAPAQPAGADQSAGQVNQ
jgi:hypothetical protein